MWFDRMRQSDQRAERAACKSPKTHPQKNPRGSRSRCRRQVAFEANAGDRTEQRRATQPREDVRNRRAILAAIGESSMCT
jgi:hypothetical protein